MFIGIGLWYMIKGQNAEPWVKTSKNKKFEQNRTRLAISKVDFLEMADKEQKNNSAFAGQCKEMELQLRKHAEKLEKQRLS